MRQAALLILLLLCSSVPAWASLSPNQLGAVRAAPAGTAAVPLDLPVRDGGAGATRPLSTVLAGRPTLLIMADYRCTQLCGSILAIAAQALDGSGLRPEQDFTLAVLDFNPDATPTDGAALRDAQMSLFPELRAQARLLTAAPDAVARLEAALGFVAVRDDAAGRYAHPVELYILTADGRVSRMLDALSATPDALRQALVEAGEGHVGTLVERIHVLCYGLDPLSGASTGVAQVLLRTGGGLTLACLGGFILFGVRRRARAGARRA